MRSLLLTVALGIAGTALLPTHQARAWWDNWGHWHPGYGPRVIVAPPPPVYRPYPPGPYAHWIPAHYNRWGRFIPGHWV